MTNKKNLDTLLNIMKALPQTGVQTALKKEWKKRTKFLNTLPKNKNNIKTLQNPQTKIITFKKKKVYDWLEDLKNSSTLDKDQKEFINWYQTEYYKISLEQLTKQ